MLITGKRSLATILRIVTDSCLLLNLAALLALPWLLSALYANPDLLAQLDPHLSQYGPDAIVRPGYPADLPPSSYGFYLGFLYAAGCATAWILLEGHLILRRLEKNEPFAAGQAGSFRRMAGAFAVLTLCFAVKIAAYNTLLTLFCCAVFLMLTLIALILAGIFQQAYKVKTENELTI
jgi:hypothetical protein